ncbi:MAG TPA: hypothetical protein VMS65_15910 [Polyangiaceae bacterium]|nr:hypothetical protein [Polyangiaceae bacterium]
MNFFEIKTPRDMLNKAGREHARLVHSIDIDHVFNFFVTAYHVCDYVKVCHPGLQSAVNVLIADHDIADCRALCANAKHLRVTKLAQPSSQVVSNGAGAGMRGETTANAADTWRIEIGNRTVDVRELAKRVMEKLESFFLKHSL